MRLHWQESNDIGNAPGSVAKIPGRDHKIGGAEEPEKLGLFEEMEFVGQLGMLMPSPRRNRSSSYAGSRTI